MALKREKTSYILSLLVSNKTLSKRMVKICYKKLASVSCDIEEECRNVSQPGHNSASWSLCAVATVAGEPIRSVY